MPQFTRRTFAILFAGGLSGCLDRFEDGGQDDDRDDDQDGGGQDDDRDGGGQDDTGDDSNLALEDAIQQGDIQLTSPAFDDGEPIPQEYGYEEANVNPPLEIDGTPTETESLALVVDDPDAVEPAGEIWVHWLTWNVPPERTSIPEDWEPDTAIEGENDFGERGYGGPNPPDEEHAYRFKLYALDTTLDVADGATVDELGPAMEGKVIARTQLRGTYTP